MLMSQKAKQGVMGFSWIIIGIIIIASVIIFGTVKQSPSFPMSVSQESVNVISEPTVETTTPLVKEQALSPKIVMYSDLSVEPEDMTFKLYKDYQESFELYRSKVFTEKKNYGKAYKKFIGDIGFTIDDNGMIIDASGRSVDPSIITCHVTGFFPDKPHIKPNC